ncbi:MAG: ATP-binding protein [Anaerolineales bacterium]|nr:ATP-binding protein [Anaerolineales bacterium]MCB9128711.1 ATP-binding protein [Ardenticatenales bacterium]MCB9172621.1 ATP-binding protein [Ardenticatenales bacterium]
MERQRLGIVTAGGFTDGLTVRLDESTSPEAMRIGDFCVLEGDAHLYFSLLQDLELATTDLGLLSAPPALSDFARRLLRGTATYVNAEVKPLLSVARLAEDELAPPQPPQPVRNIPMHFARLVAATDADFATVFGRDSGSGSRFAIGRPLTMEMDIPIDLAKLVERSTGIFGSTGTGKSFLTRLIVCGLIARDVARNLIFDMHNEYAFAKESEEGERVKGLKELFGPQVVVYSLDRTNAQADHHLTIGMDEITTDDLLSLSGELGLSVDTAAVNLSLLRRVYRDNWLAEFLELGPEALEALVADHGGHKGSLEALHRRLHLLVDKEYISRHVSRRVFDDMVSYLERGKHIILHFGKHETQLDQIVVANMVTRRIRELYRDKVEAYTKAPSRETKPKPLVITVEEAHRFLNPEMARQTIFGTIARELRKYYVTLLIVDQRPSGIDDEILSQVGTRISGKLLDDRDLQAVLSGLSERQAIRAGLASLDTKQQAMIFGHAIPMPIALRTRRYDKDFYDAVTKPRTATDDALALQGGASDAVSPSPRPATPADDFESGIDLLFGKK